MKAAESIAKQAVQGPSKITPSAGLNVLSTLLFDF